MDSYERLMLMPTCVWISVRSRAIVQFTHISVGNRLFEQWRDHTQGRLAFHRSGPRRRACFQPVDTVPDEVAAPQAHRVFANAECLRDPRTGPTGKRQKHGTCSIRLPAITRSGESRQRATLFITRNHRRLATHAAPTRIDGDSESQNHAKPFGMQADGWMT